MMTQTSAATGRFTATRGRPRVSSVGLWMGVFVLFASGPVPPPNAFAVLTEAAVYRAPALARGAIGRGLATQGAAPRTIFLIISGVSGEARLAQAFHTWSTRLAAAATGRFGASDSMVVVLGEDSTRAGVRGRSTRDNVLREIARLSAAARAGDRFVIVLFGHGATQEATPRFNVPGPDLSADDFRTALAPLRDVALLFVNTTSASGDFVKALAGANRTIITATRSGREQNETLFPEHFVAALTSDVADTDKDARTNVLEAFVYARREVDRVFEQGNRIVTEHAVLDDDGDGVGHSDASDKGPDGVRARTLFLDAPAGGAVSADPRVARLQGERRAVEARIEALRGTRATMSEDAYQQALEPLLLELAVKTRELRALEGRKP